MKLLQKRSYKHLDLFQSLIIAYLMGGVNQARKSAKKLKSQTNERDCSELLTKLHKHATDEQVEKTIERMHVNFKEYGVL